MYRIRGRDGTPETNSARRKAARAEQLVKCESLERLTPVVLQKKEEDRRPNYPAAFACHMAKAAPVGSAKMLNQPMPETSVTSLISVAPSDLALAVEA